MKNHSTLPLQHTSLKRIQRFCINRGGLIQIIEDMFSSPSGPSGLEYKIQRLVRCIKRSTAVLVGSFPSNLNFKGLHIYY